MENKSVWESIKNYINLKNIGDKVSRQELLLYTSPKYSDVTTDCYRNMLEKLGYLSKYKSVTGRTISGVFVVEKHIEKDLTSSQLRKTYDLNN